MHDRRARARSVQPLPHPTEAAVLGWCDEERMPPALECRLRDLPSGTGLHVRPTDVDSRTDAEPSELDDDSRGRRFGREEVELAVEAECRANGDRRNRGGERDEQPAPPAWCLGEQP